jgi:hypothetical protein
MSPCVPLKTHVHPELQNVTLFGNRVFTDVIEKGEDHTGLGWTLNPVAGVPIRKGEDIGEDRGREASSQGVPRRRTEATRSWKRQDGPSLEPSREHNTLTP